MQGFAIKNITGFKNWAYGYPLGEVYNIYEGCFYQTRSNQAGFSVGDSDNAGLGFDASRVVPTANEVKK